MGGNREINPLATILLLAFGRDDLRVVRYRCGICFWAFGRDDLRVVRYRYGSGFLLLGGTTSVSSGTAAIFVSGHLGGMTSVSSGTAAAFASGIWEGRPPCRPVPLRYSLLAFGRDDLRVVRHRCGSRFRAFGRDDLRVVRYRCGIRLHD